MRRSDPVLVQLLQRLLGNREVREVASRHPKLVILAVVAMAALFIGFVLLNTNSGEIGPPNANKFPESGSVDDGPAPPPPTSGTFTFCFWNVENLFDDVDDGRTARGDKEYDGWYANNREMLNKKLSNLCDVLVSINDGKGPDILALAEMESERSVELLRQAFNQRMRDSALRYRALLYKEGSGGRNIAPAILTRLPVDRSATRLLDKRYRILEGHIVVGGHSLAVLASHWTSRVSDQTGDRRAVYADKLYGRFRQMVSSNPDMDLLICGDFNDNPDDPSVVEHLHATGDEELVRRGGNPPSLFNPFALLWKAGAASHYYGAKPFLFDQICVSPGMLDRTGWTYGPDSAAVIEKMKNHLGRPNRFGGEKDKRPLNERGASDHYPVTVRLTVR